MLGPQARTKVDPDPNPFTYWNLNKNPSPVINRSNLLDNRRVGAHLHTYIPPPQLLLGSLNALLIQCALTSMLPTVCSATMHKNSMSVRALCLTLS